MRILKGKRLRCDISNVRNDGENNLLCIACGTISSGFTEFCSHMEDGTTPTHLMSYWDRELFSLYLYQKTFPENMSPPPFGHP